MVNLLTFAGVAVTAVVNAGGVSAAAGGVLASEDVTGTGDGNVAPLKLRALEEKNKPAATIMTGARAARAAQKGEVPPS